MTTTAKIRVITDSNGRVLAAQFPSPGNPKGEGKHPECQIVPLSGHRVLHIEIPAEVLRLTGPDLHRYFSDVEIDFEGDIKLPKLKIVKAHK